MSLKNAALLLAALTVAGCQVEKVEDGELPDVDIEGGELPKYDVDPRDIDAPDVDIDAPDLQLRLDTTSIVVPKLEREPDTTDPR